nr:MAG TPA: hypothetical protein [Caudoviricetes sp.]
MPTCLPTCPTRCAMPWKKTALYFQALRRSTPCAK